VPATVTLVRRGASFEVSGRQTILEAALKVGLDLEYSCRQGTCGTCRALLLSGAVEMEQEDDLRLAIGPKAIAQGYRLLCISIPRSAHIEIDL
jgi:ferredoxin